MEMQREVWNSIAEPWNHFRAERLKEPLIAEFLKNARGNVLDLCCGSGRNFTRVDGRIFALDFSENMLRYAGQKALKDGINVSFVNADASAIPIKDESIDCVVFIASLQCVEKRNECIRELSRVMKHGAEALITIWNKDQPRFLFSKKESFVPWRSKGKTYMRYYYLFTKKELKAFLEANGFEIVKITGSSDKVFKLFPKNIIAIVRKGSYRRK
ncbi:MAG: class I SAM-dependent methyltransferase [Candidatus Aenigmatarchaeota archaeon]